MNAGNFVSFFFFVFFVSCSSQWILTLSEDKKKKATAVKKNYILFWSDENKWNDGEQMIINSFNFFLFFSVNLLFFFFSLFSAGFFIKLMLQWDAIGNANQLRRKKENLCSIESMRQTKTKQQIQLNINFCQKIMKTLLIFIFYSSFFFVFLFQRNVIQRLYDIKEK